MAQRSVMEKSGFKDSKPTLPKLINFPLSNGKALNLIKKIGCEYQTLGILLLEDEDGAEVKKITYEKQSRTEDIVIDIFSKWLIGRGIEPVTWCTLVDVLKKSGHQSLAKDIEGLKHDNMTPPPH